MTLVIPSNVGTFGVATPPPFDPAVVSGVTEGTLTATSQIIDWDVSIDAQGRVEYDTDSGAPYAFATALDTSFLAHHSQTITGLTPATLYYYRVKAVSATGVNTYSGEGTFTTAVAADAGTPPTINPLTYRTPTTVASLGYLGTYADPLLGTTTKRITANATERHNYSSQIGWNADATLVNMGHLTPHRSMIRMSDDAVLVAEQGNTSTLNFYNQLASAGKAWCQLGSPPTGLRKLNVNVTTGVITVISSLTPTALSGTYDGFNPGGGQGCQSDDDRWLAFTWHKTDGTYGIGVYDLTNEVVFAERAMGSGSLPLLGLMDNCGMSHTGTWVWYTFVADGSSTVQGMWTYPRDLSTGTRRHVNDSQEHCDWALNAAGQDRFVYWNGNVTSFDPASGSKTVILTPVPGNTHISGRAWRRPGWVVISQSDLGLTNPGAGVVFALDIDHPGDAKEYGRTFRTSVASPSAYDGEVHACPSPDMTKVLAAINWGGGSTVYCYLMGLTGSI